MRLGSGRTLQNRRIHNRHGGKGKGKTMKTFTLLLLSFVCLCLTFSAVAQDIQTRGSINGEVKDKNGAAIVGAAVKVTGQTGERTATTNEQGLFSVENLVPGNYTVRVESQNFKSAEVTSVTVFVGKASNVNVVLETGAISETVTVTAGEVIDQASIAVPKLNDQLFPNVPVQRSVSSLFYLAPTTDSLGGGDPSVSGGSAPDSSCRRRERPIRLLRSRHVHRSYGSLNRRQCFPIKEVQVRPRL